MVFRIPSQAYFTKTANPVRDLYMAFLIHLIQVMRRIVSWKWIVVIFKRGFIRLIKVLYIICLGMQNKKKVSKRKRTTHFLLVERKNPTRNLNRFFFFSAFLILVCSKLFMSFLSSVFRTTGGSYIRNNHRINEGVWLGNKKYLYVAFCSSNIWKRFWTWPVEWDDFCGVVAMNSDPIGHKSQTQ